jgi:hypothetical protein
VGRGTQLTGGHQIQLTGHDDHVSGDPGPVWSAEVLGQD